MKKIVSIISVLLIITLNANAQSWLNKLGKAAENAAKKTVERRVEKKAEDETNKAIDKVEGKTSKKNKNVENQEESDEVADETSTTASTKSGSQKMESYSKYDFIPGEKVVFFTDFSNTEIGDFPAEWNTNGSGEVVNTNLYEGKWLKSVIGSYQAIWTDELLKLPENYTIEFDVIPIQGNEGKGMAGWGFRLMQANNANSWDGGAVPGKAGFAFGYEYYGRPYYRAYDNELNGQFWDISGNVENKNFWEKENQKYHVAIWVQKTRIRVYHGNDKMFDLPKAIPDTKTKLDRIRFDYGAVMFTNMRIAVGNPDMRNKLMTDGKLVTYGIYFDVNKDVVKPESYGTLKEIAATLNEVPDVKVKIVGHTDSDGNDAANLDLSKRRAASVKNALVKNFNVNGDRLITDGAGETQPVAKNDSPSNKALNRRVEFIKQ